MITFVFTAVLSVYAVNRFNRYCRTNFPGKGISELTSIEDHDFKKALIRLIVLISIGFAPIFLMAAFDIIQNLANQ
jgi:hypothetical protein